MNLTLLWMKQAKIQNRSVWMWCYSDWTLVGYSSSTDQHENDLTVSELGDSSSEYK